MQIIQLILGSQSPRRKEILDYFNIPFKQSVPSFDEESVPFNCPPAEFTLRLSKGKADSLAKVYPEALILTADTIVHQEGVVFGKPKDEEEAKTTLYTLSGKWHSVFTGITLSLGNEQLQRFEETKVLFNELTLGNIKTYMASVNWKDKAGGYGVQTAGGLLVKKIEGCYYNVMGLPVNALKELLFEFGIDLWKYIKS